MLGNWLRKKNNKFARSMISTCISTISTRDLEKADPTGFCGLAAAELARHVAEGSIRRLENEQDRLLTGLHAIVYSNHFADLIEAIQMEASHLAAYEIIGNEFFHRESHSLVAAYAHLAVNHPIAIDNIRHGCVGWLKAPSLLNLRKMSLDFGSMHNRIIDQPRFLF